MITRDIFYVFSRSVKIPCCPVRISWRKLSKLIQTIAETSTPKAGGTSSRTGTSKGSVGHTIALKGSIVKSVFGYHDMTVRQTKRKFIANINASKTGEMTLAIAIDPSVASATRGIIDNPTVTIDTKVIRWFENLSCFGCPSIDDMWSLLLIRPVGRHSFVGLKE